MKLNFDPLSEPVTKAMIDQYASENVKWSNPKSMALIGVCLYVLTIVPVVIGSYSSGKISTSTIVVPVIMIFVIASVVAAAIYGSRLQAQKTVRLKRFAQANGAVLRQNVADPSLTGMIFDQGHTKNIDDSISFTDGIEVGNYSYVTGSGKSRATHSYTFARVALKRNLPHIVLDARSNNFFGSNLPTGFDGNQKLALEGDFNKYFNVYAPKGYGRDALYLFTPDVMQALVDKGSKHDMEIIGNELYLFKSGTFKLDSKVELSSILEIVSHISMELRDQSKRYTDERVSDTYVASRPDGSIPVVALEGQRLKKKVPIFTIIFFIIVFAAIFLPPFLPEDISNIFALIVWPFIYFFTIGFGIYSFIRSR